MRQSKVCRTTKISIRQEWSNEVCEILSRLVQFFGRRVFFFSGFPEMCTTDNKIKGNYIGFGVLTAAIMKSSSLWDTTPCNPFVVRRRFGGTYLLHLQGRRINQAELCLLHVSCRFLLAYSPTLKTEAICSSETSINFQCLHGVIFQKTKLYGYQMTGYDGISFGSTVAAIWQWVKTYRLLVLKKYLFIYYPTFLWIGLTRAFIATGCGMDGKIFLFWDSPGLLSNGFRGRFP